MRPGSWPAGGRVPPRRPDEHTERERHDIAAAFRTFVDAAWSDYRRWPESRLARGDSKHPRFVVAIDDADMNPHKSAELIQLVRTLWHPRLAFVMTGDSGLFADMIEIDLMPVLNVR